MKYTQNGTKSRGKGPDEQFSLVISGLKVKIRGQALKILALGVAAAMGAAVVVKMSLF